jgi:hypothetical protein
MRYTFGDVSFAYILGVFTIVVLLILCASVDQWLEKVYGQRFQERLKNQPTNSSQVVDAEFVNVPKPQLKQSQALVKRETRLTRRQQ